MFLELGEVKREVNGKFSLDDSISE